MNCEKALNIGSSSFSFIYLFIKILSQNEFICNWTCNDCKHRIDNFKFHTIKVYLFQRLLLCCCTVREQIKTQYLVRIKMHNSMHSNIMLPANADEK